MVENKYCNKFSSTKFDELDFFRRFPELREKTIPNIEKNNTCYIFDINGWSIPFDLENSIKFSKKDIKDVFDFAYESKTSHKKYRSGGTDIRDDLTIFLNIFLGKLGELSTLYSFKNNNIEMEYDNIDYTIRSKGDWDDYDLKTKNGKILNVKSSKHYSFMLLLECQNWNDKTELIYNINTNKSYLYDYHIYSRIGVLKRYGKEKYFYTQAYHSKYYLENIEKYKKNNTNYTEENIRNLLFNLISDFEWIYEDVFIIDNNYFKKIINLKHYIKKDRFVLFGENVLSNLSLKNSKEDVNKYILDCYNKPSKFILDANNFYLPLKYMFNIKDYLNNFK